MNRTLARERREALGLSQEALARSLGVTVRTVGRWEQGSHAPPTNQLRRLARALRVKVGELKRTDVDQDREQVPA